MTILLQWILSSLSLLLVAAVVPGFEIRTVWVALLAALVLGFCQSLVRPILLLLTLPITLLTLGLFSLVISVFCVWLASVIVPGFTIHGPGPALLGTFLLWLLGLLSSRLLRDLSKE